MSSSSTDTVVIGAGIGGTCAALSLAQRGAQVVLLEAGNFPRHKVCGEFLSSESRATFRRLGVEAAILEAGALPLHAARIVAKAGVLQVPLPPGALAISRFRLDNVLWQAAQERGVLCRSHTRVRHIDGDTQQGFCVHGASDAMTARAVIAAPGRHAAFLEHREKQSATVRYLGLKAHFGGVQLEPGIVELHTWRGGYCGLVRVEGGLTNVCLITRYKVIQERSQRAPETFWQWLLSQCPSLSQRFIEAERATPWLATANVSFGKQKPTEAGVLLCGDAAGYIHPLSGDGMAMAARSGELAGAVVGAQLRGGIGAGDATALYDAAWRREFESRLQWAARLEPLLTSPALTSIAVPLCAHLPQLARFAVKHTRGG